MTIQLSITSTAPSDYSKQRRRRSFPFDNIALRVLHHNDATAKCLIDDIPITKTTKCVAAASPMKDNMFVFEPKDDPSSSGAEKEEDDCNITTTTANSADSSPRSVVSPHIPCPLRVITISSHSATPQKSLLKQTSSYPRRREKDKSASTATQEREQQRKIVSFAEMFRMRVHRPTKSLVDGDVSCLYYQQEDFKRFQLDARRLASKANKGTFVEDDNVDSLLGLERYMKKQMIIRRDRKLQIWDAVLNEQDRQEVEMFMKISSSIENDDGDDDDDETPSTPALDIDFDNGGDELIAKLSKKLSRKPKLEAYFRAVRYATEIKKYFK